VDSSKVWDSWREEAMRRKAKTARSAAERRWVRRGVKTAGAEISAMVAIL
jgi:hypothetical protein